MAADWAEIRRLAADFQRAQFASTVQRLSDRNCIEIVAKLIADKQLDVIYTLDGKEYITPAQIAKEIRDELYVHGGRINIVDLQHILNVDLTHIESKANDIVKSNRDIQLVLGQLIDETYLNQMAEEVNDRLQEAGHVTIAELCKLYDLPCDFLTEELSRRIGRIINGQMDTYDRGVIFTEAFVAQHKARIRGLFSAVTRPTPVSSLISQYKFQEHLLYSFLEEFITNGRLNGAVIGGRQDKAVYVPDIYSRTQNNWVDSFYKQNSYLEFDTLSRLGIPDPINYIKKRYKSASMTTLKAVCVGHTIVDQVEASVEEAIRSDMWVDIQPLLPSSFSVEDASILLQQLMRTMNKQSDSWIFGDTIVVSEQFINSCAALFDQMMQHKAEQEMQNNHAHVLTEEDLKQAAIIAESMISVKKDKREDRKKKTSDGSGSARAGGGGNAREIRTKKHKKRGKRDEDSDEEMPITGVCVIRSRRTVDLDKFHVVRGRESVVQYRRASPTALASSLYCGQDASYSGDLAPVYVESRSYRGITGMLKKTLVGPHGAWARRVSTCNVAHSFSPEMLPHKITPAFCVYMLISFMLMVLILLVMPCKLVMFWDILDDTQVQLEKHLLKTICTDISNLLFNFMAGDLMMSVEIYTSITSELRLKMLAKLAEESRGPLLKLHNSLNGKCIEEFLSILDGVTDVCGLMLKKIDKKKERQVLFQHRQALLEQVKTSEDPALVLHLTSVLLFQLSSHHMLHAPGRCVPQIISFLNGKIPEDQYKLLVKYQGLVVKQLIGQHRKGKGDEDSGEYSNIEKEAESEGEAARKELQELTPFVKDLVLKPRKTSVTEE
ncbi:E3 UFM1-protein ligase 1 [Leucoraja erinacea]|uniref:E3 UFM1-protein ligase 1 n=1 Tax=Leucoraja erinaceus TaxID=7782 RepID=UPI002458EDAF|nr:E3 UFM1-protein ligase 1 [Leucoraja erinacea]